MGGHADSVENLTAGCNVCRNVDMPYVITTKFARDTETGGHVSIHGAPRAFATLDARALLYLADIAAEGSPDTGEGGAWHMRTDAVRSMSRDLDLLDRGDLSEWQDGVTLDEARAACRKDIDRWLSEWAKCCLTEAVGGYLTAADGTLVEVTLTTSESQP